MLIRSYFYLADSSGKAGLVPTLHVVAKSAATARAALLDLLAGPNAIERAGSVMTQIPAGVTLHGVTISKGVATVDLSAAFVAGPAASVRARLAQVVYTLTQFGTISNVNFRIDGVALTGSMGAGVSLAKPVGRTSFRANLPDIFVDLPAYHAALSNGSVVKGLANVFEAQFMLQIIDGSGKWIYLEPVKATCGTGCWGSFSVKISYTVTKAQYGILKVWVPSAKDGKPVSIRSYPVWLTPPTP
jgi:hypothetical protein